MSKHVCVLQTSFAKREDTIAYLEEKVPGVRVTFITDSALLPDIREAGGPAKDVVERMTLYAMAAERMGADVILNSCSTVGEVADVFGAVVHTPVVKIDEPMAREAVRLGKNIALIATVPTTLGPSRRMIEKLGSEAGKEMKVTEFLAQAAWDALSAGDAQKHNEILLQEIRRLDDEGYDAIAMAQVSMRALLPDLVGMRTPVLCSFYTGLDSVVKLIREM